MIVREREGPSKKHLLFLFHMCFKYVVYCAPLSHSTGTTHWLDPRLARYLKHSILECSENGECKDYSVPYLLKLLLLCIAELPYGWEKVNDPTYGTYFIE